MLVKRTVARHPKEVDLINGNVGYGSFADMQQSPRERPLPGAKQTYLGQPRVGRRVYGKEPFFVYLRFERDSDQFTVHKIVGERFRRFNVKPPVA